MYRVIQWATGGVGKAAIQGVLRHPELELVGCWVHSADKSGRDVGELAGEGPIGVLATNDIDELLATDRTISELMGKDVGARFKMITENAAEIGDLDV
jgi:hypothetical protein